MTDPNPTPDLSPLAAEMADGMECYIRRLQAMTDSLRLPLVYRPHKYDDWGLIRDADGFPVLSARSPGLHDASQAHREAGTDPCEAIGRAVVAAVNGRARLLERLSALLAAVERGEVLEHHVKSARAALADAE